MSSKKWLAAALLVYSGTTFAQGTQQSAPGHISSGVATAAGTPRGPVATQPSANPFKNPISQGVPPAASANTNQNNNRTNVPLAR